jgi:DNA polymerase III epsilon subunit-like protein
MLFAHHDNSFTDFDRAVVVDLETTGSDPKNDRILRIACLRGSITDFATRGFTHLEQFTARLNPRFPISPEESRLGGINGYHITGNKTFGDIAAVLKKFIGDLPLIGHNVRFDEAFLSEEFNRAGQNSLHRNKAYCTMKRLRDHFGYTEDAWYLSLAEAAAYFGAKKRVWPYRGATQKALLALQVAGGLYRLDNRIPPPNGRNQEHVAAAPRPGAEEVRSGRNGFGSPSGSREPVPTCTAWEIGNTGLRHSTKPSRNSRPRLGVVTSTPPRRGSCEPRQS